MTQREGLFLRAVVAFLALPGTIAFLVPWLLLPPHSQLHVAGIPVFVGGVFVLLWCVHDFYVAGRGSLAPWAPPENLVIVGLYRMTRNPMYVGVLLIIAGWAAMFASRTLWIYAAIMAVAFHLRVLLHEEPWLAGRHGDAWTAYRARVPRWFVRR